MFPVFCFMVMIHKFCNDTYKFMVMIHKSPNLQLWYPLVDCNLLFNKHSVWQKNFLFNSTVIKMSFKKRKDFTQSRQQKHTIGKTKKAGKYPPPIQNNLKTRQTRIHPNTHTHKKREMWAREMKWNHRSVNSTVTNRAQYGVKLRSGQRTWIDACYEWMTSKSIPSRMVRCSTTQ